MMEYSVIKSVATDVEPVDALDVKVVQHVPLMLR